MNREQLEQELRGALEEEIGYLTRTQAERTASAVGGTRLQQAASWFLYNFSLEREFLVPDDSWVMARVGNERLRGVVVSVRGMELTLGLERDLGPSISHVEISVDATAVLESVLGRFQEPPLSTLADGFARMVLGLAQPNLSRQTAHSKLPLSPDKQDALERAVGSQVLFIWGPPGTGKTQALAALCDIFVESGESVLLASHTNVAVDEAIWRAAGRSGPLYETPAYFQGKLLRYGPTHHTHLMGVTELHAEAVAERLAAERKRRLLEISAKLGQIAQDRGQLREVLEAWERAERAAEQAESNVRALAGATAALAKRRGEYHRAAVELSHANEQLDRVLNPQGLRRLFRKDPAPFRSAAGIAATEEGRAREGLASAERWEERARSDAEDARLEAGRLAAIPRLPRDDALREDERLACETKRLDEERTQIEQEISGLIRQVIHEASFVASTLTRAAVDENLCRRTFDNVIVDEASMAPMPLVYLVSLAARKRVILVGDFRQLPPIVQAPQRDHPLAWKWLGRDIFEQTGIDELSPPPDKAALRCDLLGQHRMAPEIRAFVSNEFYWGRLRDFHAEPREDDVFWAARNPRGQPVSMVDTSSIGAWSQRSPGARPSKFNVYSALVAVELAEMLLQELEKPEPGKKPVGIITPYRAQANLLNVLVQDKGLGELVRTGTVHGFQGAENDVIIFDFVEDAPNWKAGPLLLDQGPRLMNVAVTRARHRLFVLGSYAHVRQHLKRSKLLALVDYAANMHRIVAEDFLREDFLRAVAEANAKISHGEVSDLDAHQLRVCSERDFFAALDYDLARARNRVVLFAPFLGHRAEQVFPRLGDCVQRGADVYVVTPPLTDLKEGGLRTWYATMHARLEGAGIRLVFFRQMHQKLVFIDHHILYVGGLNPLSHVDTAEIMDRWDSRPVFDAHAEQVRLKDILSMWDDPADPAMRTCPRPHGLPLLVVAPVTYQDYDPMFWGCTGYPDCDYRRRFSYGPRRCGPRVCDKCGAPMTLQHKTAQDWWVCSECKARRKVQEGEGIAVPTAVPQQPGGRDQPQRGAETAPPKSGAGSKQGRVARGRTDDANALLVRLRSAGSEVIDRRGAGGSLWVIGGRELADILTELGFKFAPKGSRAARRRPAWYL